MLRLLRLLAIATALLYAVPTFAQSFEGLEGPSPSRHKHRKHRKRGKREPVQAPAQTLPPTPGGAQGLPTTTQVPSPGAAGTGTKPGLGLDLEAAPKPKRPANTAPTMTFEAVDLSGKSGDRQRLDAAIKQFKDKKYEQSSLAAWELMHDPNMAALSLESQFLLAKALYRMGMYHSSLGEFSQILTHGPDTPYFKSSLEWLFFISHKTTNEAVILDEVARYANNEFPPRFRSEFRYLLARYYFVRGRALDLIGQPGEAAKSFDEVKRIALTFPRNDPFYPRAKYLEGLTFFRDNNLEGTVEDMKEVVRLTRPGTVSDPPLARQNASLRELAFMQLARTHYGARQNRYAIYYYGKIERGSPQWLEALFESAWANYRIGQYEQALGNLITLSSPFFREEYFPEALILKAVIYYENCRYRESTLILSEFERLYAPVHDELDTLLKKDMDATEYYNLLADIQKKEKENRSNTDVILARVLKLALTDKDLKNTNDSILELEDELGSFDKHADALRTSSLAKHLMDKLKVQRSQLINKGGILAKGKLQVELAELTKLLGNAERIRFETTGKEKEFLEAQLALGANAEIVKKYKYSVAVADDQLYWPYEGEYWRDELGTYQYTLTKGCIQRGPALGNPEPETGGGSP